MKKKQYNFTESKIKTIQENIMLVHKRCAKFQKLKELMDYDDIFSIAYIAYLDAISIWKKEKGSLSTLVYRCIDNALLKEFVYANRDKRQMFMKNISMDAKRISSMADDFNKTLHDIVADVGFDNQKKHFKNKVGVEQLFKDFKDDHILLSILKLKFYEEKTHLEIAKLCNIPDWLVDAKLTRFKKKCKELYGENGERLC